ncbi:MAG: L,D-transpeptidase family protein [Fimbriimonadales bacterium]
MLTCCAFLLLAISAQPDTLDGVTFAKSKSKLYASVAEIGKAFDLSVAYRKGVAYLNEKPIPLNSKELISGTKLIALSELERWGATTSWQPDRKAALVEIGDKQVYVRLGQKRAVVNKSEQELKAWQGRRVVFASKVSTGRRGYRTPSGVFDAGPYKARMHRSRLYDNAPMPWSVQVEGDVFVHGFKRVRGRPASHGCIRLPMNRNNPAKWFYEWVEVGTPISISGKWPARTR